jgi:putative ABC transport system substrate-binding protein
MRALPQRPGRRQLLAAMAALAAAPFRAAAQVGGRQRIIGFLSGLNRPGDAVLAQHALPRALAEHGYVVGRNLAIDWRYAEGDADRLPALAAALVGSPAEVIVAANGPSAEAAAHATAERPIVVVGVGDPVGIGLVDSLARPGRNVTGLSETSTELSVKRLDLLRQIVPGAARIAVVWNAADRAMTLRVHAIDAVARPLGIAIEAHGLHDVGDIDRALAALAANPPDAILLTSDTLTRLNRRRFIEFAAARRVPAMYEFPEYVRDGGLMAYGPSFADLWVRVAYYVARILDGARPGDLPLEQPTRFYLTLNLRAARALGLELSPALLAFADEVIE